jgi:hypothetical protein
VHTQILDHLSVVVKSMHQELHHQCQASRLRAFQGRDRRGFNRRSLLADSFDCRHHKSSLHSPSDRIVIALHSPVRNRRTGLPVGPAEKSGAELAFWIQQDTFSGSGLGAKHAELREFVAILRRKPQSLSALETAWRRGVD